MTIVRIIVHVRVINDAYADVFWTIFFYNKTEKVYVV